MTNQRSYDIVKETLEKPFDEGRFRNFIRNLLNHIEEEDKSPYSGQFIKESFRQYVSTLKRVAKYFDGEYEIDVLVVHLKKKTSIDRARTAQRNFIAWYFLSLAFQHPNFLK